MKSLADAFSSIIVRALRAYGTSCRQIHSCLVPIFAILPMVLSRKFSPRLARISPGRVCSQTLCRKGNSPREAMRNPSHFASSQFLSHSGGIKPTRPRNNNENLAAFYGGVLTPELSLLVPFRKELRPVDLGRMLLRRCSSDDCF